MRASRLVGVFFLGASASMREVGLYVVALKLSFITALVLKSINAVISPRISELYFSGDIDRMFAFCRLITFSSTVFALFVLAVFFCFGENFLAYAFGDEFREASLILNILLGAQLINAISGSTGDLMQMTGSERRHRDIMFFGAGVHLLATILLVPTLGGIGIAIALVLAEVIWNGVALVFIFQKFRQLPFIRMSELILYRQTFSR